MTVVEFAGLELEMRPGAVMRPRRNSVALVEHALAHIGNRAAVVVDVGTGSGAIAIAIAKRAPAAQVWATDVSEAAVALAAANAVKAGVADRVRPRRGDLLAGVPALVDVVVANLPYLPWAERGRWPELVEEPVTAVFAPGDGLDAYRRLLREVSPRLREGGLLAVQLHGRVLTAKTGDFEWLAMQIAERAA